MKHLVSRITMSSLLLFGLILLAGGCTKAEVEEDLAAPTEIRIVELTSHSVTVVWQAVEHATYYRWNCDSSNQSNGGCRPDTQLSFDTLLPGTSYHFKVRAEDNTRTFPVEGGYYPLYSDWTELHFTTPKTTE